MTCVQLHASLAITKSSWISLLSTSSLCVTFFSISLISSTLPSVDLETGNYNTFSLRLVTRCWHVSLFHLHDTGYDWFKITVHLFRLFVCSLVIAIQVVLLIKFLCFHARRYSEHSAAQKSASRSGKASTSNSNNVGSPKTARKPSKKKGSWRHPFQFPSLLLQISFNDLFFADAGDTVQTTPRGSQAKKTQ